MSEHVAHGHAEEVSVWPAVITIGILFLLPFAFAFKFVYHEPLFAAICFGIGVPLVIAGISGWVKETVIAGEVGEGVGLPAMGWFILAEALIFLTFFASYWVMRLGASEWPPEGSVAMPQLLPAIMTMVLVASSFTIHVAEARLDSGDRGGFKTWLIITMLLGLTFLCMSGYEWNHLFHIGFTPDTNSFSSAFFSITGFHGAHVFVGLSIFLAILIPAMMGKINDGFVKSGALYWHFVDIIWFFVVSQLYYW